MAAQAAVLPTNGRIFPFRKAVKRNAKLRLAVSGPGGSGKTYTLLTLATELGGRIALVDTEHGSASKYADLFEFDVLELKSYDPGILPELIAEVATQGYATLIIDSLSHFWNGVGGEREQVERITARTKSNNSWSAWREVSPKHNRMIDAIHAAPMHVLASMRVKTEWIVDRDEKTGKTSPRKVGLQPIMRDGIDYEFDICGEMDQENTLIITKSRCPQVSGGLFPKPGRELAAVLSLWLGFAPEDPPEPIPPELEAIWRQMSSRDGVCAEFEKLRQTLEQRLGPEVAEAEYAQLLGAHGVPEPGEFKSSRPARLCAKDLFLRIAELADDGGGESGKPEEADNAG
jgi:hypothetical protein